MMTLIDWLTNWLALPLFPAGNPEPSWMQLAPPSVDLKSPA
jgi:hypothetical protein